VTGEEVWYKFYSNTSGARIRLLNAQFDGVIDLYDETGSLFDDEDMTFLDDKEALNYVGLDTAAWYFVAISNYDSSIGTGTFSSCLQRLNRSYAASVGPKELCSNFKPQWTRANQYMTNFYQLPGYQLTQNAASGQSPLSDPNLNLRFSTTYLTIVNGMYNLTDERVIPKVCK